MSDRGTGPVTYFYLSYAHTAPVSGAQQSPADHWVKTLFEDLSEAVRDAAPERPHGEVGFFDGLLPAGADRRARISTALGRAEVFVPLCSPGYVTMSWPGREWSCFGSRLAGYPDAQARRHIAPVLWARLSQSERLPGDLDPLRLTPDWPEYAENGLRALKMLTRYHDSYQEVVRRLAREIVGAALDAPLGPSAVPPVDSFPSAFHTKGALDDFAVVVAAPARHDAARRGRDTRPYGDRSIDWRPFGGRVRLSLAELAVAAAERLDFSTAVLGVTEAASIPPGIPAVILIDPWITDAETAGAQLRALRSLFDGERRHWTLPLAVLDPADPQSARSSVHLLGDVRRVLAEMGALTTETARRGARGVTTIDDFASVIPIMVAEAERQYIKQSGHFRRSDAVRELPDD